MPLTAPWSLSDDQVYSLVAYLLFINGIVPNTIVLTSETLAKIDMPNRQGFKPIDAELPGAALPSN
ncbi:MAG: hypothetical protein EXR86_13495 [Gammaproteobacteria bacterium]|nr:hypothetical protein [Gammaproteobacteria bacterium]